MRLQAVEATTLELGGLELVVFDISNRPVRRADLTVSENAIASLVAKGYSTGRIAGSRGVSRRTIANQLASIYGKMSINSRAELLRSLRPGPPSV